MIIPQWDNFLPGTDSSYFLSSRQSFCSVVAAHIFRPMDYHTGSSHFLPRNRNLFSTKWTKFLPCTDSSYFLLSRLSFCSETATCILRPVDQVSDYSQRNLELFNLISKYFLGRKKNNALINCFFFQKSIKKRH